MRYYKKHWHLDYTVFIKGLYHMNFQKRITVIILLIVVSMLILPIMTVNTIKADAGMLAVLIMFFVLNPAISIAAGIIAGKNIKHLWFTPILVAGLFWCFSSLTYKTAFPVVYSGIYLVVCLVSMLITGLLAKGKH